jgi:hypothetical protein
MRSAVSAASLSGGIMAQLTNWRFSENDLVKRWGVDRITSNKPDPAASYRGCWSGTVGGSNVVLVAFRVGAQTLVYRFDTTLATWAEITANVPFTKYGVTRFTADGAVTFAAVSSPNYPDAIVIGNANGERPRIYTPSTNVCAQIEADPYAPLPRQYGASGNTSVEMGFVDFSVINSTAGRGATPYSSTAGKLTAADAGVAAPSTYSLLTASNTVAVGDTASFNVVDWVGGTLSNTNSSQLVMVVGGAWLTLLDDVEIGVVDTGASYISLYSPGDDYNIVTIPGIDSDDDSKYLLGISLQGYTINGINQIRFTWRNASIPATAISAAFYLIATGGLIPGGCSYGYTWDNPETQWETPGRVIGNVYTSDSVNSYESASANVGGSGSALLSIDNQSVKLTRSTIFTSSVEALGGTRLPKLVIPNSPLVFFKPIVRFPSTAAAPINQYKHTTCNLYRSDPGEQDYFLVQSFVNATYGAGWVVTYLSTVTLTDTTDPSNKDFGRVMPDAAVQWVPPHACSMSVSGRLYVGTTNNTTLYGPSTFASSDAGYPTRFRVATKFLDPSTADPNSGTATTFPGEYVTGICKMPSAMLGVSPALVFTDRSVYRFDGIDAAALSRPAYLGPHGTRSPATIAEHNGLVYYVDAELQIRMLSGYQTKAISDRKVEDKTKSATMLWASGACYNNRYYMFYRPSGASVYKNCLVYEEDMEEFCEDDYGTLDLQGTFAVETGAGRRVFLVSNEGHVYELERPGESTDDTVAITGTIKTPIYHSDMWRWMVFKRVGVVCDKTNSSITVSRSFLPASSGQSGTIDLNVTGTTAYRYERVSGELMPGGSGTSCQITLTDSLPGGARLQSIITELEETNESRATTD